jgi:hypothetical protein
MNITRNNYEEYFMLYIDNELSAAGRQELESFVQENPDLAEELVMLKQSVLSPETDIVFSAKEDLFRTGETAGQINHNNYEEYFVLYGDNELTNQEKDLVEQFVYKHPQYQEEFELIQQIKYTPETQLVFPDKSILYRRENDEKVIPLAPAIRWWRIAVAAAVILFAVGTTLYMVINKKDNSQELAGNKELIAPPKTNEAKSNDNNNNTVPVIPEKQVQEENREQVAVNEKAVPADKANMAEKRNERKENKTAPIVNEQPKEQLAVTNGKKLPENSNILPPSVVKQERKQDPKEEVANIVPEIRESTPNQSLAVNTIKPEESATAIGPVELKDKSIFTPVSNDDFDELPTENKKNKMRGFFRKVTRVFDKATSKESSGNEKDLHIAGFAIALK